MVCWLLTPFDPDIYILGLAIIGSILLYPAGGMHYIDALFFASGCATQSGLNTYNALVLVPHTHGADLSVDST